MVSKIPRHLLNSMYRQFNKTEFGRRSFGKKNVKKSLNINLERDMSIYEKKQTTYEKTNNTLKTFTVDVLQFEIINNHGVRVLAVPTDEANNLDENATFIISYGDASLLAVKTGSIESSLNRHFIVIQFNLIALRECTDWECAVVD